MIPKYCFPSSYKYSPDPKKNDFSELKCSASPYVCNFERLCASLETRLWSLWWLQIIWLLTNICRFQNLVSLQTKMESPSDNMSHSIFSLLSVFTSTWISLFFIFLPSMSLSVTVLIENGIQFIVNHYSCVLIIHFRQNIFFQIWLSI